MSSLYSRAARAFPKLAFALVCFCACARAQAVAPDQLKPQGYVNDFAHALAGEARNSLEQHAYEIEQRFGVQVALVTVQTVGDTTPSDYANRLFKAWGVGHKHRDDGIMVLLAIHDRKYWTEIGYGLEPYITDADAGTWMRELIPDLRSGNYSAVFEGMLNDIEQTLAQRMGGAAHPQPPVRPSGHIPASLFVNVFLILLFFYFFASVVGRAGCGPLGCLLPFLWTGGPRARYGGGYWGGGGGFGGGGFGGFGGGGGFGGFGGGASGGAGAGGSW